MKKDLLCITDLKKEELIGLIDLADMLKANPLRYSKALNGKTLLMMFEKPSLRTRVSFEAGMSQMAGHAIYYDISSSPFGKQKESISDTAKTASRYVDIIMARLFAHKNIKELAAHSSVPVINALTDYSHPCQILADLQTIREVKGRFEGLKLAYVGDANNNVTHSLMAGCSLLGIEMWIGCPEDENFMPKREIMETSLSYAEASGGKIIITDDPVKAVKNADIVVTDSWMSYHITDDKREERIRVLTPYQVNKVLFGFAKPDAIFMHCLPAMRGMEVTSDVIDSPASVVFDEAENRLHTQKALMLRLLKIA